MSFLSNAMKLQEKLDTLASMVQAAKNFSAEVSETYQVQLQHSGIKLINHLLEVASQEVAKVARDTEINNPSLQRTTSNRSDRSMRSSDTNYNEETLQKKRRESAAQRDKIRDLQDIRERLAKVMHYRPPSRSLSSVKGEESKGSGSGNSMN